MWYDEVRLYNFRNQGFSMNTAHFTQLVWKNSKEVGFGLAQANDGVYYFVASYFPGGNMQGDYPRNVTPN